jgi:hypothetical protein
MRANPQFLQGGQQALDPLLPAGRVRHDVRARPCAADFFQALGFDVDDFDRKVITLTNEIAKQVFPRHDRRGEPEVLGAARAPCTRTTCGSRPRGTGGIMGACAARFYKLANGVTVRAPVHDAGPSTPRCRPTSAGAGVVSR